MLKQIIILLTLALLGFSALAVAQTKAPASENSSIYLVVGSGGPGFTSPAEAVQVLEQAIIPTFDMIMKLQDEKKILGAGLPVGERAIMFMIQASSNGEVDKLLRSLPAWSALTWKVTALESIAGRAAQERDIVSQIKKTTMK